MDARWKHPFTCIVAGPTGCGKSTFVTRLLRHATAMIDRPPEKITWFYGEWQEAYATTDLTHVRFEEGLPTESMFESTTRNLIVIDDLMTETDERVTTLFTKKSHHRNTSVLYLVQNLFPKKKRDVPSVLTLTTWWCSRIHAMQHRCRTWLVRCIRDARNSC